MDSFACGSGGVCVVGTCCDRDVYTGAAFCGGSSTNKRGLVRNGCCGAIVGRYAL